jgi:methylated-DNA-[protein]-cysteine S-methyltransferase
MSDVLTFLIERIPTPIGEMRIVADDAGKLRATDWDDCEERMLRLLERQYGKDRVRLEPQRKLPGLRDALKRYFAGELAAIEDLPTETAGTDFQRSVWRELRKIPAGTVISYGTLAQRIQRPKAVRAVGLANGANPIGVVVPCHRVIGADGSLTGYGSGIERKRWLLDHERKHASKSQAA